MIQTYDIHIAEYEGRPLILMAMEYAEFGSLRGWLTENRDNEEKRRMEGVELFKQACLGVQAIHDAGHVHLDLKPENVLLCRGDDGQPVVKVSDLGIARNVEYFSKNPSSVTHVALGTPAYMSPEQFLPPRPKDVRFPSDVYSLGVILFEILDGDRPFHGNARELREKHVTLEAPELRDVDSHLASTVRRCLAKKPDERFDSAEELLIELEGPTPHEDVDHAPERLLLCESEDLDVAPASDPSRYCLVQTLVAGSTSVYTVVFSPDGTRLASGDHFDVKIWNAAIGQCIGHLKGHSYYVNSLAFSPDGKTLVSGSGDETIRAWDPANGACLHTPKGHSDAVQTVAFSPDGARIASGGDDSTVRIWSASSGMCLRVLDGHTGPISSIAFSPDGWWLASSSMSDKYIRLWDVSSGRCVMTLRPTQPVVYAMAFSPAGDRIMAAVAGVGIQVWEARAGRYLRTIGADCDSPYALTVSADGERIVAGSRRGGIRVWDVLTGECLEILHGPSRYVQSVAFSPDGKHIVACGSGETIFIWGREAQTGQSLRNDEHRPPVSPLHLAAMRGDVYELRTHLSRTDQVDSKDIRGNTALLLSAARGHTEIADVLLRDGADVNAANDSRETALHIAAENGHTEMTARLLAAGAGVNARDSGSRTPLHLAMQLGHPDEGKPCKEVVDLLLSNGADIGATDDEGRTALHAACLSEPNVASLLLDRGADIDAKTIDGETVRMFASDIRNNDIEMLLSEYSRRHVPRKGADTYRLERTIGGFAHAPQAIGVLPDGEAFVGACARDRKAETCSPGTCRQESACKRPPHLTP